MFKSKKQRAAEKAARKAAARPVVNKVVRPGAKPIGPKLQPVNPVAHGKSGNTAPVRIHMLANALIGDVQYAKDQECTVPMSTFRAIGTSCVSMAKWRIMKEKGGLGSLHK